MTKKVRAMTMGEAVQTWNLFYWDGSFEIGVPLAELSEDAIGWLRVANARRSLREKRAAR